MQNLHGVPATTLSQNNEKAFLFKVAHRSLILVLALHMRSHPTKGEHSTD